MRLALCLLLICTFSISCVSRGKYNNLQKRLDDSLADANNLQSELRKQELIVEQLRSQLGDASSNVEEMKYALDEAAKRKREREKRIKEYTDLVRKFRSLIDAGKLNIRIVRGRMVVQLDSDILFRSGSDRLSSKGKQSIEEVAKVLAEISDKEFQVEGHTDNVPIRTSRFPSNWELASARAMSVLTTMKAAGMSPERVSIASFGEYKPAADNSSTEGKAANRRIEIVVLPDLSHLPGFDELNRMSQ